MNENLRPNIMNMSAHDNAGRPLRSVVPLEGANQAAQRLLSRDVAVLREAIHQQCPHFIDGALARFVQQAFAMDEVVEAYFFPKVLASGSAVASAIEPTILIPYEQARRAALQAKKMAVLDALNPLDRHLAYLAALLYPCGLFLNAHPAFQFNPHDFKPDGGYLRTLSFFLLEAALDELRGKHEGIAEALSFALGFRLGNTCNSERVARLTTAVYLPNVRVTALWSPL